MISYDQFSVCMSSDLLNENQVKHSYVILTFKPGQSSRPLVHINSGLGFRPAPESEPDRNLFCVLNYVYTCDCTLKEPIFNSNECSV